MLCLSSVDILLNINDQRGCYYTDVTKCNLPINIEDYFKEYFMTVNSSKEVHTFVTF